VQVRCVDGVYVTTGVLPREPAEYADLQRWLDELGVLDQLPEAVFLEMAAQRDAPVDLALVGEDDEVTAMVGAAREAILLIAAHLPAKEFFVESQRRGFPSGAVLSPEEAFEDAHFAARGFRVPVEHPELGATFEYPGVPYRFSATPSQPPRRPPLVGEHDDELLGSAG
jgi:crotonobetainyl-CoA:carnitine CoA-transferase CaiB-like acyl-CoA transferase